MVMGFMNNWPGTTTPTNFVEQILSGQKKHSFRESERWKPGREIHMATGVRTKNYNQFNTGIEELAWVVSTQKVSINAESRTVAFDVDRTPRVMSREETLLKIAKNDGFESVDKFFEYFGNWQGYIVHWTDLRY